MKTVKGETRSGAFGRLLFQHKESCNNGNMVKKKDKARMENAHMHSVVSVAGLAAALAAVTATENSIGSSSKMSIAWHWPRPHISRPRTASSWLKYRE